jgi:uncharacterized membrane protein
MDTFAGLGVSLAGFAGLIHALDRSGSAENPVTKCRIRNIVNGGFGINLAGLLVWPVFRVTEDVELTVGIVSGFMLVGLLRQSYTDYQPGPAWPSESQRRRTLAVNGVIIALMGLNLFITSVGFLEFLFVLAVLAPIGTFTRAVSGLHDHGATLADETPTEGLEST